MPYSNGFSLSGVTNSLGDVIMLMRAYLKAGGVTLLKVGLDLCGLVGMVFIMGVGGSDDGIIQGIKSASSSDVEDIIDTNQANIRTVVENQRRMYHVQMSHKDDLEKLFYRGIGAIVTLMAALIGLLGAWIVMS